jgi:hypothetical protein
MATCYRTILVAKARHASGARQRIAFTQRADAPAFEEQGIFAPRGSGEAQETDAAHWSERI